MPGTAQRLGTAMKSNASAGFKSKPVPEGTAATHVTQPNIEEKKEKSEEEQFKELEEEVHRLLEASATAKVAKNNNEALQKAKEAATKEKKIRSLREQTGSLDQVNIDHTLNYQQGRPVKCDFIEFKKCKCSVRYLLELSQINN